MDDVNYVEHDKKEYGESGMKKLLRSMEAIAARRDEELQMLLQRPDLRTVATMLTDALLGNLAYLCNFRHLVDGFDQNVDIQEVYDRLRDDIYQTFENLTGKPYVSETGRHYEYLKAQQRKQTEKLLRTILDAKRTES